MSRHALLPYRFSRAGRHALVLLVDPARLDWRAGFFELAMPRERPTDAIMPYDEWLAGALTADRADYSDTGAIFHVSRCGSTLLAQNLKACGALVLSEPPFMRILRQRLSETTDSDAAVRAAALVIGQWQAYARDKGQPLVVKFNSQAHDHAERLMAALPGARFAFLHREPLPVLESLARRPPSFLVRESRHLSGHSCQTNGRREDLTRLDADALLVAAARRYLDALRTFAAIDDPRLLTIGYAGLQKRFPDIARHFLGNTPLKAGAEWRQEADAKTTDLAGAPSYRPIEPSVLSAFARSHRPLLDHAEAAHRLLAAGTPALL